MQLCAILAVLEFLSTVGDQSNQPADPLHGIFHYEVTECSDSNSSAGGSMRLCYCFVC